jgi:TPR repeat protein
MINLGEMLDTGKYIEKDKLEALKWFQKASDKGDTMASKILEFKS